MLFGCMASVACAADALKLQPISAEQPRPQLVISIADQRLALVCEGGLVHQYPVSTSKFGAGDSYGSYRTPLGKLRIADKIGDNLSPGAVIRHRSATGEVLRVNAPGRDPIVTRILWLDGLEAQNRRARERGIYIHGTPEEKNIGEPVSWGCIRMRSKDVIELFNDVPVGADVTIIAEHLPKLHRYEAPKQVLLAKAPPAAPAAKLAATPTNPPSAKLADVPKVANVSKAAPQSDSHKLASTKPASPFRLSILLADLPGMSLASSKTGASK